MNMNYTAIYLAHNEWGNRLMQQLAIEHFEANPDCQFVLVHEHAGWSMGWRRDGSCWSTANDRAVLPPGNRPRGCERVIRRGENGSDYWMINEAHGVKCGEVLMLSDGYFPDGTPRPPRAAKVVWFSGPDKWPVVRYEDNQQTETISPNCVETARLVATH